MACNNLTLGLDPSCDALKKLGGLAKRVWVGQLSQLDSFTVNENTLDIETLIMAFNGSVRFGLKKFVGKKLKHNVTTPVEVGENINVFNQTVALVLYHFTSLEKSAIEGLVNGEDLFVLVETFAGQIEVYGIDTTGSESSEDPIGGLNASAGEGGTGTALNDPTAYTVTLSGQHRVMSRIFNISSTATLAQNIAYLDARSDSN